ncbi:hypothetical protein ACNFJ7_03900 [Sphingomonas sp. HT-1]|uniref:hypothetical protein n=1 Tax=unclassified Sphingomonas TaxID=196159 RepID=UPI00031855D9|nr:MULTISPECIES: hypothetical protein [unclassified Sphingomonas]KTF69267.1 hypothetical protein ATB93_10435 [Sphingomonas sp. WG]
MGYASSLALLAALLAAPGAQADALPTAKLVRCDAGDCLLIRGERRSAAARITINDHLVPASGRRGWKVRLPLATVRNWASPFARTLAVAAVDASGRVEWQATVRLPIGLLGHDVALASLVVRAR